ncbi:hypothetical protein LTR85_007432 [Meristemomyces frigidus]|nr:hypothetical protein LTR85_007432 [Meristemomyces frigidus]
MLLTKSLALAALASTAAAYDFTIAFSRWTRLNCAGLELGVFATDLISDADGCVDFSGDPVFKSYTYEFAPQGDHDRPDQHKGKGYCDVQVYTGSHCTGQWVGSGPFEPKEFLMGGSGCVKSTSLWGVTGDKSVHVKCWESKAAFEKAKADGEIFD